MNKVLVPFVATVPFLLPAVAHAQRLIAVDSFPGSATVYQLDPATGARTALGSITPSTIVPAGFAYDPVTGRLFMTGTGTDSVYVVDLTNWKPALIGPYGNSAIVMHGLEWDNSTGTLYGMSAHDSGLYSIDTTSGAATLIGVTGLAASSSVGLNLCYDLAHDVMYMTSLGTDSLYTIDRSTGLATLVGPMTGTTNISGLAFDLTTMTMYAVDNLQDNLYTLDVTTGAATLVGSVGSSNMLGLVHIDGAGRLSRAVHGCGPTTITPTGHPAPGHTITTALGGTTGLPFIGFGLLGATTPYCGCVLGHDWLALTGGAAAQLTIPMAQAFLGLHIFVQGADVLGTGGCQSPQFTLTDTIEITIG